MEAAKVLKMLYEVLAVVREGNTVIAEIIVEDMIRRLELEVEREKHKPWCWP